MNLFSQRQGLAPHRGLQVDGIDKDLRNSLYNSFHHAFMRREWSSSGGYAKGIITLYYSLHKDFFKEKLITFAKPYDSTKSLIFTLFNDGKWEKVYDFIDFVISSKHVAEYMESYITDCNMVLEREGAGYRIVTGQVIPITNKEEIESIESALKTSIFSGTFQKHFENALQKLSDRNNPDYRNSVKESISAVESVVKQIVAEPEATWGMALSKLDSFVPLHPSFRKGIDSLYGYTSSEDGIRHAIIDGKTEITFDDAKFMLVTCSAFANYLLSKYRKK